MGDFVRSPELQAQIDAYYAEWRESRAKWKTPRGKWFSIVQKLQHVDTYRFIPRTALSGRDLVSLRAVLLTSPATRMCRWSVRRDGDAVVIQQTGMWRGLMAFVSRPAKRE